MNTKPPLLQPIPDEVFNRQPLEQKVEILFHQVQGLVDVVSKTNVLLQGQAGIVGKMLKLMDRLSTIAN